MVRNIQASKWNYGKKYTKRWIWSLKINLRIKIVHRSNFKRKKRWVWWHSQKNIKTFKKNNWRCWRTKKKIRTLRQKNYPAISFKPEHYRPRYDIFEERNIKKFKHSGFYESIDLRDCRWLNKNKRSSNLKSTRYNNRWYSIT